MYYVTFYDHLEYNGQPNAVFIYDCEGNAWMTMPLADWRRCLQENWQTFLDAKEDDE